MELKILKFLFLIEFSLSEFQEELITWSELTIRPRIASAIFHSPNILFHLLTITENSIESGNYIRENWRNSADMDSTTGTEISNKNPLKKYRLIVR